MRILAIESSTSSAKALVYDSEKGIIRSNQCTYRDAVVRTGMTDTEKVYELTVKIAREITEGEEIAAVSICGIWHGLTVCDENMKPQTPNIAWNFTGTSDLCRDIRKNENDTEWLYRTTGCMPHNTYPRHALTYLKNQGMDLSSKKIITQGGYNFYRLTGEFLETACIHSGSGLINLKAVDYDDGVLSYLGIKRDQLGTLGTYQDTRPLSEEGARALGVRAGIPVVPAHADGALNQVGNFANQGGKMTMSIGTSGAIRVAVNSPITPKNRGLWCYYGVDKWLSGAAIAGCCNCIDWYKKTMLQDKFSFDEMEKMLNPKKETPVFLPFLYGERCPGWKDERKGGFISLTGEYNAGDLYMAVQRGILFNLYQCYQVLCELHGKPEVIVVSGGILNSGRWQQMAADIFGQDIQAASCPNASTMGAVALALHAAGGLADINEFKADYDSEVTVTCNESQAALYEKLFEQYMEAYERYE